MGICSTINLLVVVGITAMLLSTIFELEEIRGTKAVPPPDYETPDIFRIRWPKMQRTKFASNLNGYHLMGYHWLPKSSPKAVIFTINGFGDYSDHWAFAAQSLAEDYGLATFSLDFEGTGRSAGLPGYIESFNYTLEDTKSFMSEIKAQYNLQEVPVFVMGESMGGLVSILLGLQIPEQIEGILLLCPAVHLDDTHYSFLRKIVRALDTVIPKLPIGQPFDQTIPMSPDPNMNLAYKYDPRIYKGRVRVRTGVSFLDGFEKVKLEGSQLKVPFVIFHGTDDRIINPKDSKEFFDSVRIKDKTYVDIPNGWHNFMKLQNFKEIWLNQAVEWISSKILKEEPLTQKKETSPQKPNPQPVQKEIPAENKEVL